MAGRRPQIEQTRNRERMAWDLHALGWTESRIAEEMEKKGLGRVTQQAVSAMLIRVEKRVLGEMKARVAGMKVRQTQMLMHLYNESLEAWQKSKEPRKTLTTKGRPGIGGMIDSADEQVSQVQSQHGDARLLSECRELLADIRKVWGLDKEAPEEEQPMYPPHLQERLLNDPTIRELAFALDEKLYGENAAAKVEGGSEGAVDAGGSGVVGEPRAMEARAAPGPDQPQTRRRGRG